MGRVTSEAEAKDFIAAVSKKYHDATHNTYAYTLGLNDEQVKASDNGEPSGTAGIPELKALQLMKLKNVAVVVTRYFGGIKLGAGRPDPGLFQLRHFGCRGDRRGQAGHAAGNYFCHSLQPL